MDLAAILKNMEENMLISKEEKKKELSEKVLRCPQCRSTDIRVFETIEAISEHHVVDGVWLHKDDNNEYGDVISVDCKCESCGHRFKSKRGINFDNYYIDED